MRLILIWLARAPFHVLLGKNCKNFKRCFHKIATILCYNIGRGKKFPQAKGDSYGTFTIRETRTNN